MRALQLRSLDGPSALELVDCPEPQAGDDSVLIDAVAVGVVFSDLLTTKGLYQVKQDPPFVPGADVAGIARRVPPGSAIRPGDRVMALASAGCFAETVAAPAHRTFRIPDALSFDEAAGFLMNYHTAHSALHRRGRLAAGETVLVHGAAGGVGTAAIQVAKAADARVLGAASSGEKMQVARAAGADDVVRTSDAEWVERVREMTGGRGVDVVVDTVGGERFHLSLKALAPEGRILVVGFASGEIPEVRVNRLLLRNISVMGVYAGIDPATVEQLAQLAERGALHPVVGAVYPLVEAADALASLENRSATGKVVIRIRDDQQVAALTT